MILDTTAIRLDEIMELDDHRRNLRDNPDAWSKDKDRAIERMAEKIRKYHKIKKDQSIILANKIWEAQGGMPLLYFENSAGLPMCWNYPFFKRQKKDKNIKTPCWDNVDYCLYEIGHLNPRNRGGTDIWTNLCFMSARCNAQIQSALRIEELLECYFKNNEEVMSRWNRLRELHNELNVVVAGRLF